MHFLSEDIWFPEVSEASKEGLLAVGGDLSPERLIYAYKHGIFPWFELDEPILWWSPDPRFVLFPDKLKISKSMKQVFRRNTFKITRNKAFKAVIEQCAFIKREGQSSSWITPGMIEAYCKLHDMGYALSVEVWKDDKLVGGLYGVDLKNGVFCGESMFSTEKNASKAGFITFVQQSNYRLIDCQVYTAHLASLGAENIERKEFIKLLN